MKTLGRTFTAFALAMTLATALELSDDAEGLERFGLNLGQHEAPTTAKLNLSDCLRGLTDATWPEAYRVICADLAEGNTSAALEASLALRAVDNIEIAPLDSTPLDDTPSSNTSAEPQKLATLQPLAAPSRPAPILPAKPKPVAPPTVETQDEIETGSVTLAPGPQSLGTLTRSATLAPGPRNLAATAPARPVAKTLPTVKTLDAPVLTNPTLPAPALAAPTLAAHDNCHVATNGVTKLNEKGRPRSLPPEPALQKTSVIKQPGVALLVQSACSVESPIKGKVLYAGAFKGYLGVVILRLTSGQQLIIAGLDHISVKRGDPIAAGQILGVTSTARAPALAAAYQRDELTSRSLLYFDMRNANGDGDKLAWLEASK